MGHVGLVVFHIGVFFHHLGVGFEFGAGADHDFVHDLALVLGAQAQRLSQLHIEVVRRKTHVVAHADGDGAASRFGFSANAPGLLLLDHWASGFVVVFVHVAVGDGQ